MEIKRIYLDTDMRMGHVGLREKLRKDKINPDLLADTSFILFLNKTATRFKLFFGQRYVIYYNNGSRRIPLEAIQYLPEFFRNGKVEVNRMIEKSIRTKLNLNRKKPLKAFSNWRTGEINKSIRISIT